MKRKLIILGILISIFFICLGIRYKSQKAYRRYYLEHIIPAEHGLTAYYYDNTDWNGKPVLRRIERKVYFKNVRDMGLGEMEGDFKNGNFSISWRGLLTVPCSGIYKFKLYSDDGSYLYLNDMPIVENGGVRPAQKASIRRYLRKGIYPIEIKYFQAWGETVMELRWRPPYPFRYLQGQIPAIFLKPVDTAFDKSAVEELHTIVRGWNFIVMIFTFVIFLFIFNL